MYKLKKIRFSTKKDDNREAAKKGLKEPIFRHTFQETC